MVVGEVYHPYWMDVAIKVNKGRWIDDERNRQRKMFNSPSNFAMKPNKAKQFLINVEKHIPRSHTNISIRKLS